MKIGIISSHFVNLSRTSVYAYETEQLRASLKRKKIDFELIDVKKMIYGIVGNHPFCRFKSVCGFECSVSELDVLLVRRTRNHVEVILDFLEYAKKANPELDILDPVESFHRPTSKVTSIIHRAGKFSQPDTQVISYKSSIIKELQYPIILKPTHGCEGKDVISCGNIEEFESYISSKLEDENSLGYGILAQQELKKDNEYRVVVIGGKSVGCVKKIASHEDQIALNASDGAKFERYDGLNVRSIELLAENISNHSGQAFSGVDIVESSGQLYVLECNRNPQFAAFDNATGMCVADLIVEYCVNINLRGKKDGANSSNIPSIESTGHTYFKPSVFIGSSTEGLPIAEIIQQSLIHHSESTIWNQGVFEPGKIGFQSLVEKAKEFDIAVFPLSPDDLVTKREQNIVQPRDNVLFEIGLFMGVLGAERVFIVINSNDKPNMPSDFNGLTTINWLPHRKGNLKAALGSACTEIKQAIDTLH